MEEMLIEVSLEGDTKISVKGVKGTGCKDLTRDIEKALGVVESDRPTAEMREESESVNQRRSQR